jgi:hypothetical protein
MSIEKFLTRKAAKSYSNKNHGICRVLLEYFSNEKKLRALFDQEIERTKEFRAELQKSLSPELENRKRYAEYWTHFLKPRIAVLKFWSTLCTAFMAVYALGGSLFTLAGVATGVAAPATIILSFLLISIVFLLVKYLADKRAFWYEYLVANLDAIAKL